MLASWYLYQTNHYYQASLFIAENDLFDLQNQSNIVFIWNNPWNRAWYYINISCRDSIPYGFQYLPEDKPVEIILREDCQNNRIPIESLDTLTHKKFPYVYWDMYFRGSADKKYHLNEVEAKKIAQAPWEVIAISGFDKSIGQIFRDTKNSIRKWFEPTGTSDIYTDEDQKKCDPIWWNSLQEWTENEWKIQAEKVLECYKNLLITPI